MVFLWNFAPYNRWVFWRFGGTYCLHLQGGCGSHGCWSGGHTFLHSVGTLFQYTEQKPKRRLSADWQLLWKLQNFYQNLKVLFLFWILKIFNHLYEYALTLHIMVPASILSRKHEDCLKRLRCHLLVLILQMFTHKNSYDLRRDVKGGVVLLNMSSEVFWKGSAAVSVGGLILIFRECNCSTFKFQSNFSWVFQPMEMRQLRCLKMTGSNYPWTLCHIPQELNPSTVRC